LHAGCHTTIHDLRSKIPVLDLVLRLDFLTFSSFSLRL
jgi:hypothetical protein